MSPAISTPAKDIEVTQKNDLPVVLIARSINGVKSPTFRGNDNYGISLATNHLISLGHTKIAMIGGADQASTDRDLYSGYIKAIKKAG